MNAVGCKRLNMFEKIAVNTQRLDVSSAAKRVSLLFVGAMMAFQVTFGLVQGFSFLASVVGSAFGLLFGAPLMYLFSKIGIGSYRASLNTAVGFELTDDERAELVQWYLGGRSPMTKKVRQARSAYLNLVEASQLYTPLRRKLFFRANRQVARLRQQLAQENHG